MHCQPQRGSVWREEFPGEKFSASTYRFRGEVSDPKWVLQPRATVQAVFLYKVLTVSGYQFPPHPLFKKLVLEKEDLRKEESRRARKK